MILIQCIICCGGSTFLCSEFPSLRVDFQIMLSHDHHFIIICGKVAREDLRLTWATNLKYIISNGSWMVLE